MDSLKKYIPLVKFMGIVFGSNFEIILHDVSDPESSIIAIENSHISGRSLGGPMTDLALRMMNEHDYCQRDFIANYDGRTKDGKMLVSSTYYLHEDNRLIGLICINHDVQDIIEAERVLNRIKNSFGMVDSIPENRGNDLSENLDDSIIGYSTSLIHATLAAIPYPPGRMSVKEKIEVIHQLDQQGVFSTKGVTAQLADFFDTSESTIYRYLARSRKQLQDQMKISSHKKL